LYTALSGVHMSCAGTPCARAGGPIRVLRIVCLMPRQRRAEGFADPRDEGRLALGHLRFSDGGRRTKRAKNVDCGSVAGCVLAMGAWSSGSRLGMAAGA